MTKKEVFVTRSSMPSYEEYIKAIKPLWDTHRLTNMGVYHHELEKMLAEYLDVPEMSLIVNGHLALELTIQSFGFPSGSEVITTPFTFISTTHAIVRNGLQPIFCDVKETDGTIDETKIEELVTEKTVAILPVHVYGNVCNIDEIHRIADKYSLKVIYDAAHAFGESYKGRGIGNYGDASIFSFHATKVFNSIEGGGVVCKDHELYEKLYNLKNFGIRGEELVVSVGANAKMNEFSAIMGILNLKGVDGVLADRKRVHDSYNEKLYGCNGLKMFSYNESATHNYAYYPVLFDNSIKRDKVYNALRERSIYPRKYFYPLTADQACFKNKYKNANIDVARDLSNRVLVLPIYEGLDEEIIQSIAEIIKETIG